MAQKLGDAAVGDRVISYAWTAFSYGSRSIPSELVVVEKTNTECVWCSPADGITTERIPLWSQLDCRIVACR